MVFTCSQFVHITPLLCACDGGRTLTASLLIEGGADINYQDEDGWTPLIFSCTNGYTDTIELFIEKKAQLDIQTKVPLHALHTIRGHQLHVCFLSGGMDCLVSGKLEWIYQDCGDLTTSWC